MKLFVRSKKLLITVSLLLVFAGFFYYLKIDRHYLVLQREQVPSDYWGITFSTKYARELGLDWRQAYSAMLDELQVKKIRLPIYWDDIEATRGQLYTDDYDWMLNEAEQHQVSVLAVIGRRQPRWPECHQPNWVPNLSPAEAEVAQASMVQRAIEHFRAYPAITAWQLENEYFVTWFGECPTQRPELLDSEIATLRQLDSRPLVLTDSGEFSRWRQVADRADIIGNTMYRVAWNQYTGYTYSAWPAWLYKLKAHLVGFAPEQMIVAELQAEPWPSRQRSITELSALEIEKSFSLKQFETNSELARRTGFSTVYYWGAEWWYWMKLHNNPSYWDYAQQLISD